MSTRKKQLKMYVLVRKDLDDMYAGVQGGHALAEYSKVGDCDLYDEWNNGTLIYLGVPNEIALMNWKDKLNRKKKKVVAFYEPDLDDELTAIACIDTGEVFKRLSLA